VTFFVVVSSGTAISYQWRKNGANITDAKASSFTIPSVKESDAGLYSVKVVNGGGTVISSNATLTVLVPAQIVTQPQNRSAILNQNVSFSVVANGTDPVNYQWKHNGINIPLATSSTLTLNNVQTNQAGNYSVFVTNLYGSDTSDDASLAVLVPPVIVSQPQNQTVIEGQAASISVGATGTPLLRYQWRFNGFNLAGATNSSLTDPNVQSNYSGNYTVVVTNAAGSITSAVASLTVLVPPSILTQPQTQSVIQNQSTTLSVGASGTAPFNYQWRFNGSILPGATNGTLPLSNIQSNQTGNYTVVVTNVAGSITSAVATVTVLVPPTISAQPLASTIIQGENTSFSVGINGSSPLTYRWRLNGVLLAGGTNALLSLGNVQSNQSGGYSVIVTNTAGAVTSTVATLTVLVPPSILTQPLTQSVIQNQSTTLSVLASGTAPFSYQWRFNDAALFGATNATLPLSNIQSNQSGNYIVVVTNVAGSITSVVATVTVLVPPTISAQPQASTIIQGENTSFSVGINGSSPLTYRWRLNGVLLAGGTNALLSLGNVQSNQSGGYSVIVTNTAGAVTSTVATLTVLVPPSILTQPLTQSVIQNQSTPLSVLASGTAPLSYQWRFNDAALLGATNATLPLSNIQSNQSGNYIVVVTNIAGVVTSAVATVTVLVPPTITSQPVGSTNILGDNLSFSVGVNGSSPFTYRWRLNGSLLTGATNALLNLMNVQSNQSGGYTVIVTNAAGSITSSVATLTVLVPPTLLTQPQSQSVIQNQSPTLTVGASGTAPFDYQWRFNGTGLSGATNAALTLSNIQSNQTGNYTVVVTNIAGIVTSAVATVTVLVPPRITSHPESRAVVQGQSTSFSADATGTTPLTYRWRFNGTMLAGATNALLQLSNIQSNQSGNYTVVVTNVAGSITSSAATLTVFVPAGISTQPKRKTVNVTEEALFTVVATGTAPFGYQWRFNGANIDRETGSELTVVNSRPFHAGDYSVVVTNLYGAVTSAAVALTVNVPTGKPATLWLSTEGPSSVLGQSPTNWSANQVVSFDAPGLSYGFNSTFGAFRVEFGFDPPHPIRALYFVNAPLRIGNPGTDADLRAGDLLLVFNVAEPTTIGGVSNVFQDDVVLYRPGPGRDYRSGTFSMLLENPINDDGPRPIHALTLVESDTPLGGVILPQGTLLMTRSDAVQRMNVYMFRPASVGPGATTSSTGQLLINGAKLGWFSQVQGLDLIESTVRMGSTDVPTGVLLVSLEAAATLNPFSQNLSVQPTDIVELDVRATELDGVPDTLATASILFDGSNVGLDDGIASEHLRSITIIDWTSLIPLIIEHPTSQLLPVGENTLLRVSANGGSPLSYQWVFKGAALPGATNATLVFDGIRTNQAGTYVAIVSNSGGSVTSAVTTLTVEFPPYITAEPTNQAVILGRNTSFSVVGNGLPAPSYQWYFNEIPLEEATSPTLQLNNSPSNYSGNYTVVLSNYLGSVTSVVATLIVNVPPTIILPPTGQSVFAGDDATFFVGAMGTAPFRYQWRFNGVNLAGATNATWTRTNARPSQAGSYSVVVTNAGGSVTSILATLSVAIPAGTPSTLWLANKGATTATGGSPTNWGANHVVSFDGPNLSHGVNSTFGTFRVMIGFLSSLPIRALCFVNSTNRVGNPGSDVELRPGDLLLVFNIGSATTVGGLPNVQRDDVLLYRPGPFRDYTNGTFSMLLDNPINDGGVRNINALTLVESDTFVGSTLIPKGTFLVARSDGSKHMNVYTYRPTSVGPGTTSSGAGTLLLSGSKLGWTSQIQGLNLINTPTRVGATDLATGSLVVSLDSPATINPSTQGLAVQPADLVVLDISATEQDPTPNTIASAAILFDGSNVGLNDGVSNEELVSVAIIDWANLSPLIKSQPTNSEVTVGGNASFSAAVNGGLPTGYQWNFNGVAVDGATNLTLTLTNVQTIRAGGYSLVASNTGGVVSSVVATLTVNIPPAITTPPQSQTKLAGQDVALSVVATGTGPLGYQWNFNGTNLVGATSATLLLAAVQSAASGSYTVAVTNMAGTTTSVAAILTVTDPPSVLSVSDSTAMTPTGFNFQASVPNGSTYVVEASTNLLDWLPISTNVAESANITITDAAAVNHTARFYRISVR